MSTPSPQQMTQLLQAWGQGEDEALEKLIPLVHQELRRLARRYMFGERAGHTLQATALVNEAYVKLLGCQKVAWQNRAHFFAISAQVMRRILVDSARARGYQKRGGGIPKVTLDECLIGPKEKGTDLVALDDALKALAAVDPRKGRVVELRFFRRLERPGNGHCAEGFSRHGSAGLAAGKGLAGARDGESCGKRGGEREWE